MSATYGYCPHCGAEVVRRTRGLPSQDTCANGHVYLARFTLPSVELRDWREMVADTLAITLDYLEDVTKVPLSEADRKELAGRVRRTTELIPLIRSEVKP
jgi:hypothetical protein